MGQDIFDQIAAKQDIFDHVARVMPPADYAASQGAPPLKSKLPTPEEVSTLGGGAKAFFSQLANITKGALGAQYTSVQQVPVEGAPAPLSMSDYAKNASLGNIVKNTASDLSSTLAPGANAAEKTGSGLANFLALVATKRAAAREPAVLDPLQNRPQPPTPAEAITNAINPPAKQMAGMDKTVEAQLPNILKYAQENKVPIRNRQDFMNVARQAGEAAKNDYKTNILGPHSDVARGTQEIPNYQGETLGNGSATLSQLEGRLTKINALLSPRYDKGAGQALATQAALAPEQSAMLNAEANGIRSLLNQELASRTGMSPAEVSAARSKGAQMASLADKMQNALNVERRAANVQDNRPADLEVTWEGALNRGGQLLRDKVMGKPADRSIRNALSKHSNR